MTKTIRKMLQRALATRQVLWVSAILLHQNFSIGTFRSKRLKYMNIWQNGHNITLTLTRGLNYQFEKPFEENDFVEENLLQANTGLVAGKSKAAMSGAVLHSHCHLYIHFEYNYAVLLKTVYWRMFRRWKGSQDVELMKTWWQGRFWVHANGFVTALNLTSKASSVV